MRRAIKLMEQDETRGVDNRATGLLPRVEADDAVELLVEVGEE